MGMTAKGLQTYARKILDKHYPDMPTPMIDDRLKSTHYAGKAFGTRRMTFAKWGLADREEARSTLRHELAHCIISFLSLPTRISHGKEFHAVLKNIAPKTWRKDLHWNMSATITQAREKQGIKPRKYVERPWHLFGCANIDCAIYGEYKWALKNIPSYVKRGLFPRCKLCNHPTIQEFDLAGKPITGKNTSFASVY